jgi:hypothetical protein
MVSSFLAFVFTAAFCIALLGFVIMHIRLVLINQSTIEAYEKRPLHPWPYDQGYTNNFIDVFGRKKKFWFLPIVPEEHRRRLLAETLDVVAVPLPSGSIWQRGNSSFIDTSNISENYSADDGAGGPGTHSAVGDFRGAVSSIDSSLGSDVGMVLIERPNDS